MKLHKLSCPNCNGTLDLNVENKEYIFCPYCGQKFLLEDGKKEYTINKNINIKKDIIITKNVTHTNRTIDDAEIIRAKSDAFDSKFIIIIALLMMIVGILGPTVLSYMQEQKQSEATNSGKISAGSFDDYEGENYEAVVEQLKTLGFENIKTIDLDDAGIALWKSNKVESVSIGGDTKFSRSDYFEPNIAIIIKYH